MTLVVKLNGEWLCVLNAYTNFTSLIMNLISLVKFKSLYYEKGPANTCPLLSLFVRFWKLQWVSTLKSLVLGGMCPWAWGVVGGGCLHDGSLGRESGRRGEAVKGTCRRNITCFFLHDVPFFSSHHYRRNIFYLNLLEFPAFFVYLINVNSFLRFLFESYITFSSLYLKVCLWYKKRYESAEMFDVV